MKSVVARSVGRGAGLTMRTVDLWIMKFHASNYMVNDLNVVVKSMLRLVKNLKEK